jgi:hypothetical protein
MNLTKLNENYSIDLLWSNENNFFCKLYLVEKNGQANKMFEVGTLLAYYNSNQADGLKPYWFVQFYYSKKYDENILNSLLTDFVKNKIGDSPVFFQITEANWVESKTWKIGNLSE